MKNIYERTPLQPFGPVYVPGEQYAFYINFDKPISDPNFEAFSLDIYQGDTEIATGIGVLQKDLTEDGINYNIFCVFEFPNIPNGNYKFSIRDPSDGNIEKVSSNCILVESEEKWYSRAPTVMYRNETNFYGFNYENIADFFNIFRLPLIEVDYQYELQKTQYRNASDRRLRNIKSDRYKYRKVESYMFDEWAHDAASCMYEHDGIYIDGIKYVTKDAYAVEVDTIMLFAKGSVNAYVDNPNLIYKFPINNQTSIPTGPTSNTMAQKTRIKINDGSQLVVDWQNDVIPGTTVKYAARHGNYFDISEVDSVGGIWIPNGTPSYEITGRVGDAVTEVTFSPQVQLSEFTII